ncbi:hypothetical protein T484DRAFT_3639412, partial [Baffinella frigidus]
MALRDASKKEPFEPGSTPFLYGINPMHLTGQVAIKKWIRFTHKKQTGERSVWKLDHIYMRIIHKQQGLCESIVESSPLEGMWFAERVSKTLNPESTEDQPWVLGRIKSMKWADAHDLTLKVEYPGCKLEVAGNYTMNVQKSIKTDIEIKSTDGDTFNVSMNRRSHGNMETGEMVIFKPGMLDSNGIVGEIGTMSHTIHSADIAQRTGILESREKELKEAQDELMQNVDKLWRDRHSAQTEDSVAIGDFTLKIEAALEETKLQKERLEALR